MQNQWNFRDEILRAAHRWPIILLFFLAGCLIGFGISCILPHYYRAEANIHVSYNADSIFRNPDDYKNWYMEQLNVIVQSDEIIKKTLERLKAEDPYWQNVSSDELAKRMHVYWRNVGNWRLVAEQRQPARAEALVQAWKTVTLEEVSLALKNALIAQQINDRFIASSRAKVETALNLTKLTQVKNALSAWRSTTQQNDPSQPIDALEHWRVLSLVTQVADLDSCETGSGLMEQMPPQGSPLAQYQEWIDRAVVYIDAKLPIVQKQLDDLTSQTDASYQEWLDQNHIARGLTMYLTVESLDESTPSAKPVRRDSMAALVGGILGLIVYCFIWLALPALKDR